MKSFLLRFVLPLLLGAFMGILLVNRMLPIPTITRVSKNILPNAITENLQNAKNQGILTAFGFYPGMNIKDYDANVDALGKTNNPFVKQFHTMSSDNKTVPTLALVFPSENFEIIAREIAKENGGMTCQKRDNNILCEIVDKAGNVLFIANNFIKDNSGNNFGVVFIADKQHASTQRTPQDTQVLLPNQQTTLYYGKI